MDQSERWLPFAGMEMPALALFAAAGGAAAVDWFAVGRGWRRAEYFFKPATLVLLVLAAALVETSEGGRQGWFVVALVLSLVGDVFLMLPDDAFVSGLVAFLGAHVAYVVGFHVGGAGGLDLVIAVVVVGFVALQVGGRVLDGVRRRSRSLTRPVGIYIAVISAMVASAIGHGNAWATGGAVLFAVSDGVLAWNRFVQPLPAARVLIMVTYHLGQGALVYSLAA
jgi:uncharacterized membrane protein YhhN